MRFKDKVVIVTGAGGGIGQAAATMFAEEGASVVVADYDTERAKIVVKEINANAGKAMAVHVDVADEAKVDAMAKEVVAAYKGIDILFNSAGILIDGSIMDIEVKDWHRVLNVNLTGSFLCSRAVIPFMRKRGGGAIVNTSSSTAEAGALENVVAYITSKGAVSSLTRCMALELIPDKIRVNEICPGPTDTPMLRSFFEKEEEMLEFAQGFPAKRLGKSEEVAAVVLFLASDESSYVNGASMAVDGGQTAHV